MYSVTLTSAGQAYTQKLTLKPDPRIKVPQSVYDQQFALAERAYDAMGKIAPALHQASVWEKQIADLHDPARPSASGDAAQALDAFSKQLETVVGPVRGFGEEVPDNTAPTLRSVNADLAAADGAIESADAAPTREATGALAQAEQELSTVLPQWQSLQQQAAVLNQKLTAAGLKPLR